ncbi:protein adenylyltransferase SelO [Chitinilyticum litopenaei]|uniref:protein adenylyltransferase SelO n=1 Tax=Chitinilyticum litopenaei TaxID=1121276 RepID=UPI0011863082|nr:YdiU family protein [Chitinilyticum litopenaei]
MSHTPHILSHLPRQPGFSALGDAFSGLVAATPVPAPRLAAWNGSLASELGLHPSVEAHGPELAELLAGNVPLVAHPPRASVYAGHQFGVYVPQLGDGRALLCAEFSDPASRPWELQLKGAGPTPYSRRADGRAVLRSSIREYLCSEAMHALGIPTTRALALVHAPEQPVWRERRETAAIVSRAAPSFLRFGHFEYWYYRGEAERVRELADWTIARHFPECREAAQPYRALLSAIISRSAGLVAGWQAVGFCHGVLNSDNMSVLGLTLDYGPFGFLDGFDAGHICNHSDERGRYAYDQQPRIVLWNLYCLGQAFMALLCREDILAALDEFQPAFERAMGQRLAAKLGLRDWQDDDWTLYDDLQGLLAAGRSDWTIFWRSLSHAADQPELPAALRDQLLDRAGFAGWHARYRARLAADPQAPAERKAAMLAANPAYVLRNHLAEQAIRLAEDEQDYREIARLQACLAEPFVERSEFASYAALPPDWARTLAVSCSS